MKHFNWTLRPGHAPTPAHAEQWKLAGIDLASFHLDETFSQFVGMFGNPYRVTVTEAIANWKKKSQPDPDSQIVRLTREQIAQPAPEGALQERGALRFELNSGRRVRLEVLLVERTCLGVVDGEYWTIRANVLGRAPRRVRDRFGPDWPAVILPPPENELPTHIIMTCLHSDEPVHGEDASRLAVCWFDEDLPHIGMGEYIKQKVVEVDWNSHAQDMGLD